MCGIVSIFRYRASAPPVEREELQRMSDAMVLRGPDGSGLYLDPERRIGQAHRRLAILDVSAAGAQPMSSSCGKFQIVFNGEIYNFRALRAELERRGHQFHTGTDTEVILCGYREFGKQVVTKLRGMFAFALWDSEQQGLFIARDHFGIKPLYLHDDGGTIRVASQVKALLAGRGFTASSEAAGHVGFYLWGSVPEPFTLYQRVFAVPAGHTIWVDHCGARAPEKYFDVVDELALAVERPLTIGESTATRAALRDSVAHHLVSDVPVGVFLSSGIDSTTIAALATQHAPIQAVTLGFDEYVNSSRDEVPLAREVALRYGCRHHVSRVSMDTFHSELDALLDQMDQPSIDGVNMYFVSRAAAELNLKVALSGVGADELLGGYAGFRQIPLAVKALKVAGAIPGLGRGLRRISARFVRRFASPKYASLFEYGGTFAGAYLLRRALFLPWELPEFLDRDFVREGWFALQAVESLDHRVSALADPRARISAMEINTYLRNTLLRDADWAGMAHSLEIRTPFVDVDLFRRLAPFIARGVLRKTSLHAAVEPPLPTSLLERPKTGFSTPVARWLQPSTDPEDANSLRKWALRVNDPVRVTSRQTGARVLTLMTDAYGGRGGIAKFNRDLLWSIASSSRVQRVAALPRHIAEPISGVPQGLLFETSASGGKTRFVRSLFRAIVLSPASDIVICGHLNLLPLAWVAARRSRAKLWCVIHGIDAWQPHQNALVNRLTGEVDRYISVSDVTAHRFAHWAPHAANRIVRLSNCYDPVAFRPGPANVDLARRFGLRGAHVLLTCGRLVSSERSKGFDEVISVLPDIAREVPSVRYVIVGDGDDRERLERKAAEHGVEERVVFTGYLDEPDKLDMYRLADAFVMPSRGEGFGIVFLEAMACGVPAIASKLDGGREALADGKLGTLVDPLNPLELKAAVLRCLAVRTKRPPDGLEQFSLEAFRKGIDDLLARDLMQVDERVDLLSEREARSI